MENDKWKVLRAYVDTPIHIETIMNEMNNLIARLREDYLLDQFYFNRYIYSEQNKYSLILGFYNIRSKAESKIDELLKTLEEKGIVKEIETKTPDLRETDSMPKDEIKCLSYDIYNIVRKKLSINQMSELLHYFLNQIGYTDREEAVIRWPNFENLIKFLLANGRINKNELIDKINKIDREMKEKRGR